MYTFEELNSAFNSLINAKNCKGKDLPVGVDGMTGLNFKKNQCQYIREIKRVIERFSAPSNKFDFGLLYQLRRVKKSGGYRHLYVPRIRDQIVFKCMFEELKTELNERGLILKSSPRNFVERFHDYSEKNQCNWVLRTDISSFYNSIDRSILLEELQRLNLRSSLLMLIRHWLSNIRYRDPLTLKTCSLQNGLPQGISLSSLLAEYYLTSIDNQYGPRYFRYIDDIVIFCNNKDDGRIERDRLMKLLKVKNLELSRLKTQIVPLERGVEWLGLRHYPDRVIHAEKEKYGEWRQGVIGVLRKIRHRHPKVSQKNLNLIQIKKEIFSEVDAYLKGDYNRRTKWYKLIMNQGQWKEFDSFIHGQIKFALKYYGLKIETSDILPSIQINLSRAEKGMKPPITD